MKGMDAETARILGAVGIVFTYAAIALFGYADGRGEIVPRGDIVGIGNSGFELSHFCGMMKVLTKTGISDRKAEAWILKNKATLSYAPLYIAIQMDTGAMGYFKCISGQDAKIAFEKTDQFMVQIMTSPAMLPSS